MVSAVLLLSVSFICVQTFASTPKAGESAEEQTLRELTEQYALALAAGDLGKIREFWNPQSPNLTTRLKSYQNLVSETRIEFVSPQVTRLEVSDAKAISQFTADEQRLDRKTGAILNTYSPVKAVCRSFQWTRISGKWMIENDFVVQDELAARLEAAATQQERDALLEKEKAFVTNALLLSLSGRGIRYSVRGDHDAALRCFQIQQALAEKIGDQIGIAGALLNAAQVKHLQEDHALALQLAQKALSLYEAQGLKRGVAMALEKLSSIYRAFGDHRRAFACAQKSLRLSEEENNRRAIVLALNELEIIYGQQNNPEQALAHQERAVEIARGLGDKILVATMQHDIGAEHMRLHNYQRAMEIYQELLKQTEGYGDKGGAAMVRDQVGKIFAAQGKFTDALNNYNQSLRDLEAAKMRRGSVVVLIDIARLYLKQERYAEALPSAQQAVAIARETGRQMDVGVALTSLGYCQLGLNRLADARQSFSEAVSIGEKLRNQAAGGVEDCQRYFEEGLDAHHGLVSVLVKEGQKDEALLSGERAKARVLLDILEHGQVSVQKAMTRDEQAQEQQLKSQLTQLNKQLSRATSSKIAETEALLEKTRLEYEAFQNSLYAAHPELKVQRGEASVINTPELAALLPDDTTALLEYVVTDDHTYLFVITKSLAQAKVETQVYTLAIKQEELARQTEAFRQQLARRDLGFRDSANKLYELLVKPAAAQLRGKSNLVVVPDDTLWDLPFQALVSNNDHFLIEDATIAYAPSLTVLREMTQRRKSPAAATTGPTLLALGNPNFGKENANHASVRRDGGLNPLPEAEQEVAALRRLYGVSRSKVYIGEAASEERVKREAGQAKILHFATHGTLNNASPMYSHLALAEGDANEDGLLEAWELMALDLKADLAVLSACETARGRIGSGEGMIGFSWALFIAGVPSLVVSQWEVESAGTRDLMINFHRGLLSPSVAQTTKPVKAEALRQAALKLMKDPATSHPFYWAGFVLIGDGK